MTLYSVDLHPDVEADYTNAYHWYELQQLGLGEKLVASIRAKLKTITENPETFGYKGTIKYREAKVDGFPFLIVYRVYPRKKKIVVSSINHTKMNPNKKYRK